MPVRFPGFEQPGPELPGLARIAFEARPELPDLAGGEEGEDIVRLRLPHELAGQIGADFRVWIPQTGAELLESHLGVPEKIGLPLRVDEVLWGCRLSMGTILPAGTSYRSWPAPPAPGRDIRDVAREKEGRHASRIHRHRSHGVSDGRAGPCRRS